MSSLPKGRTRSERVSLLLPQGRLWRAIEALRSPRMLLRLAVCAVAAIIVWVICGAWVPPFPYRVRYTPARDIQTRITFQTRDQEATLRAQGDAAREVACVYQHDTKILEQAQQALKDDVFKVIRTMTPANMDLALLANFLPPEGSGEPKVEGAELLLFEKFQKGLADDQELARFSTAVKRALVNQENNGVLVDLSKDHRELSVRLDEIEVVPTTAPNRAHVVKTDEVRIQALTNRLGPQIEAEFKTEKLPANLAEPVFQWLLRWFTKSPTLTLDVHATKNKAQAQRELVPDQFVTYAAHEDIVVGGKPLEETQIALLQREHDEYAKSLTASARLYHSLAYFGMWLALYVLCGFYIYYRERRVLTNLRKFLSLMGLVVVTVALYRVASYQQWYAELIPILLFGITAALVYRQELALLLSAAVALIVVVSCGHGLDQFVTVVAAVSAAILLTGRVRSRTKLLYDGLLTGVVAVLTSIGVGTLLGQPLQHSLLPIALWFGFWSIISGLLMTGLLPFVERLFDVQTDISLLELGDAAHPLLQELVRRAPGTYNHSINVASIAEAAAESIGANGLLCRVGAYFHDIGKMLKPNYFVENQGPDSSRHGSLMPTMSTLVIIAHVKDGADLARQHHLPQSIIDFIEQHHGTTLVEYFYSQAQRDQADDPESAPVDESSFRYPGPKPQTREAGVMMLADAVEGASRTLVDPTPARIENLVHDMLMKRLLDGQFDSCGLTLRELHLVEDSLVKSLTAVYHGRVKYPSSAIA